MESLYDSLLRAQHELSRAGVESAAIGGLAVAAWGRARATQDVDLKVLLDRSEAQPGDCWSCCLMTTPSWGMIRLSKCSSLMVLFS